MARAAFTLSIRPDRVDDYVLAHAAVWPEMRDAIRSAGIHNYSIFLDGTQAFGYFEADDIGRSLAILADTAINERWQVAMSDLLEERINADGPSLLPEIFRLD